MQLSSLRGRVTSYFICLYDCKFSSSSKTVVVLKESAGNTQLLRLHPRGDETFDDMSSELVKVGSEINLKLYGKGEGQLEQKGCFEGMKQSEFWLCSL